MDEFKTYVLKLLVVCFAVILCEMLCENGVSASVSKAVKVVCGLCLCISIFSFISFTESEISHLDFPTSEFGTETDNVSQGDNSIIISELEKETSARISEEIYENFGIKPSDVRIHFTVIQENGKAGISLQTADVTLSKNEESYTDAVKLYLKSILDKNVNIYISG